MSHSRFYAPRTEPRRMTKKQLRFTEQTTREQATRETHALRDLDRLAILTGRLSDLYINAHDAIQRQEHPRAGDTMGIRGSDVSDPTLAAVTAAWHASQARDGWCTAILTLLGAAQDLERSLTAVTRRTDAHTLTQAVQAARCSGMALRGYDRWGDETCTELAVDADGVCSTCRPHRARWIADPTYVRVFKVDRRRGARLPAVPGITDHGRIAGAARLLDTSGVQIEGAA